MKKNKPEWKEHGFETEEEYIEANPYRIEVEGCSRRIGLHHAVFAEMVRYECSGKKAIAYDDSKCGEVIGEVVQEKGEWIFKDYLSKEEIDEITNTFQSRAEKAIETLKALQNLIDAKIAVPKKSQMRRYKEIEDRERKRMEDMK